MAEDRSTTAPGTTPAGTTITASPAAEKRAIATDRRTGWHTVELLGRGTTFAVDRPGPSPEAPTVVLLHGLTATGSLNWTPAIAALGERYRVVALDHRGHGRGIRSGDPFTLEDCADDVVALIDALGVAKAIFVGYSMGGPIAQLVWRRHRDRVSGLVFCATAADFTTTPDHWPLVRALEKVRRVTHVVPRSIRVQAARPFVGGLVSDPALRDEVLAAMNSHEERSIHEAERAIRGFRSTDWIGEVDVPVVVVVTARDMLVRPVLQRQLASAIPAARTIEINAAHLAAFTRPELTANAVVAACDAIALPAATTPQRRFGERVRRLLQRRGHRPRQRGGDRP
jgi:pimeloyl-ACP methyl ester carboxylesterase